MITSQRKALKEHRRRLKRRGIVRLEVAVREQDVPLVRGAVEALADANRVGRAREILRKHFAVDRARGLKALLAAAPLDGIDLPRSRDTGRDVDL